MPSPVAVAALRRLANARLRAREEGQDLLEYALLFALIGARRTRRRGDGRAHNQYGVLDDHCQNF